MKKLAILSAIALSGLFYNAANAQVRLRVGIHFGSRPVYAPARVVVTEQTPVEYNEPFNDEGDEDYYYLPDVDAYYSVNDECYYYNDGGRWVNAAYLPGAYRDFDWRYARRYEVRAPRPYLRAEYYRNHYNGVAFNGRWNERRYGRGYGEAYHNNGRVVASRYNDHRFENRNNSNNHDRFDNHGRDNRHNDRFAQNNNNHGNDRRGRDSHRPGRF
jgi:hypothetical protein